MSNGAKMSLNRLPTGVPGLDDVLGGGLPEYSFNLLAGAPGCGKTTLIHQLTFANASAERPALYFTVVGEPPLKMLRYQQQMDFFDAEKAGSVIRFVDLSPEVLTGNLDRVLALIVEWVEKTNPAIVVVDSFRTVLRATAHHGAAELELQSFLQRLAIHLTTWQVTSFLVGEYSEHELHDNPVFTVADGIVWLTQSKERNAVVRKLEVVKMRGAACIPGLHTFRISSSGVQIYPRRAAFPRPQRAPLDVRCKIGIPGLDEMMRGGLPAGDVALVAGPSGVGKSVLATHFIHEAVRSGEPCVLAIFEEQPSDYLARAKQLGLDLDTAVEHGLLKVVAMHPLDLSADEVLHQVQQAVAQVSARRLVIDSLNGVELALSPTFRDDFRESLYRMVGHLSSGGVTVMFTVEIMESFEDIRFSPHAISFLAQNVLFMRYVEIEGRLRRMVAVVKMRRSAHSPVMREFQVTSRGMVVLDPLSEYAGVLRGVAQRLDKDAPVELGLTRRESVILGVLRGLGSATLQQLVAATTRSELELSQALDRLVDLDYAQRLIQQDSTVYRALERMSER